MSTMTTATPVLTAADRCDRCSAQAYVKREHVTAGELLFCAHHERVHGDVLNTKGFAVVIDNTAALDAVVEAPE